MPSEIYSTTITEAVNTSYISVKDAFLQYGLLIIAACIILALSWVVAEYAGKLIKNIFDKIKLDSVLKQAGAETVLEKSGMKLNTGIFFGGLVKWIIITVMFLSVLQILGLGEVSAIIGTMIAIYLPKIVIAIIIMLVAIIIADVLKKIVTATAANAHLGSARMLGSLTKVSVIVFAVLSALVQLGIAVTLINTMFIGFVVAVSLASGLAFGLGGKELAARILAKSEQELTHKK
jgi:small-conductance mechanosensitive channel